MKTFPTADGWSAWDTYFAHLLSGVGDWTEEAVRGAASAADFAVKAREKRVKAHEKDAVEAEVKE